MENQGDNIVRSQVWVFQWNPGLHCQDDEVVDNKAMQVTKFDREGKGVFLMGFTDNEILIGIK